MAKADSITPETLRQVLRYEPETGKLFWRPRPAEMFKNKQAYGAWNTKYAGKEAFTAINSAGYRAGYVFGRGYQAHRVIWAVHYGEWPKDQIDHVDNAGLNNRIGNLRAATHSENMRNQRTRKSNKSGYKGVYWNSRAKAFHALIRVDGERICLGYYATAEAAHAAYCAASEKYHGDFARTE